MFLTYYCDTQKHSPWEFAKFAGKQWCQSLFFSKVAARLKKRFRTKKSFYKILDEKRVSDNKVFWKKVKPSFSDKGVNSSKITLVEKNSIIVDEKKIANIMNNYFINITKTLNLKTLNKSQIDKFENHISIKRYTKHFQELFQEVFILNKYPVIS